MKSLTSYITEAVHSTTYIYQLRSFIQDQRDNYPELQTMFPELIKPWGTGTVDDLTFAGFFSGQPGLYVREPNLPVIGVCKFEGKMCIIFKFRSRIEYYATEKRKKLTEFGEPIKTRGGELYDYTYVLCDINDRYGDDIRSKCEKCELFGTTGMGFHTKDPFKQNNEIYIRRASTYIHNTYDSNRDYKNTEDEARAQFEAIRKVKIELYTIDLDKYEDLVNKSDNAPVKRMWDGDVDALYDFLLHRGALVREMKAWTEELSTKVKWYAKNKIGLKSARLKTFTDEIEGFYGYLSTVRDRIKESKDGKLEYSKIDVLYGFINYFDRLLLSICGQQSNSRTYFGVRVNRVNNYKLDNPITRLYTFLKKPFIEPAAAGEDAPSFEMESQCPSFLRLVDILYDIPSVSKFYSDYKKYINLLK